MFETPKQPEGASQTSTPPLLPAVNLNVTDALTKPVVPNTRDLQRSISATVPALAQNGFETRVVRLGFLTFCLGLKFDPTAQSNLFTGSGVFRDNEMKTERDMVSGIRDAIPKKRVYPFIGLMTAPDETHVFNFLAVNQKIPFRGAKAIRDVHRPIKTTPEETITGIYSTIADIQDGFPDVEVYINGTNTMDGKLVPSLQICVPPKNDSLDGVERMVRRGQEKPDNETISAVKRFLTEKKCPYVVGIGYSVEPVNYLRGRPSSGNQANGREANKPTFQQIEFYYPE